MPATRAGAENAPDALVICCTETPVASFLMTTVAPGITPPSASTTTPLSELAAVPWADADRAARDMRAIARNQTTLRCMKTLLFGPESFGRIERGGPPRGQPG